MNYRKAGPILAIALLGVLYLLNRSEVKVAAQDTFLLKKITASGYELQSVIKLQNDNLLSSTIVNIDEKYYINEELISIMHLEFNQGIPGRKTTEFPLMVRFDGTDLNNFPLNDTTVGTKTLVVRVEGEIEYKNFIGGGKTKVASADTIKVN
jgi:LEA14-like dessication related protein